MVRSAHHRVSFMSRKIGVGLYGKNGHQVRGLLEDCPFGEAVASAEIDPPAGKKYETLDEMLADPKVELVSLCSPRRADQARDAIACLKAGKHVYAEKPAAFTDAELDEILAAAKSAGREFHEMADTVFHQPFHAMRTLVRSGKLGDIVQVWAQKSYKPSLDVRPQDEQVDGGLTRQCAIHAVRMIEHITGIRISAVQSVLETQLGNPRPDGELRVAASFQLLLENGGIATVIANYCNPKGFGRHGNDQIRIFGTLGMAEIVDGTERTRVVVGDDDLGPLEVPGEVEPFLHSYLKKLLGLGEMPMSLEEELHPLRIVNQAKALARLHRLG